MRRGPRALGEIFGYTVWMHEATVTEPELQVHDGPRSPVNRLALATHFVAYVVLPGVAAVWATTLGAAVVPPGDGVVRMVLVFAVLPVYYIYLAIYARRFFPRSLPRALWSLVPLAFTVGTALARGIEVESAGMLLLQMGLPLFVGFMTLLATGLVVIAVPQMKGDLFGWPMVVLAAILLVLYGPVVYIAVIGLRLVLGPEAPDLLAALSFFISIGMVIAFHLGPVRVLYRAGQL